MTEIERALYLSFAWLPTDGSFAGRDLRPLSMGSHHLIQLMGLTLLDEDCGLDELGETREIAAYVWLHSADLKTVALAMWDGSWQQVMDEVAEPLPDLVAEFRVLRARLLALAEAAEIKILPRPPSKHDDTPPRVEGPTNFAHRLAAVARASGMTLEHVAWSMPLAQAWQIYHAEMSWHGQWTVRRGTESKPADFEDFHIPGIDTP